MQRAHPTTLGGHVLVLAAMILCGFGSWELAVADDTRPLGQVGCSIELTRLDCPAWANQAKARGRDERLTDRPLSEAERAFLLQFFPSTLLDFVSSITVVPPRYDLQEVLAVRGGLFLASGRYEPSTRRVYIASHPQGATRPSVIDEHGELDLTSAQAASTLVEEFFHALQHKRGGNAFLTTVKVEAVKPYRLRSFEKAAHDVTSTVRRYLRLVRRRGHTTGARRLLAKVRDRTGWANEHTKLAQLDSPVRPSPAH